VPETAELPAERVRDLAAVLAEQDLDSLPPNVYAPQGYTQFRAGVLRFRRDVEARPFAGMAARTGGPAQERYDRIRLFVDGFFDKALTGTAAIK
jgi:hypothetical protein